MSEFLELDQGDDAPAVIKVTATPKGEEGTTTSTDNGRFRQFIAAILRELENVDLSEAFEQGERPKGSSEALETVKDAGEIAAKNAAKSVPPRQVDDVQKFIEQVKDIEHNVASPMGQALAFSKLLEANPETRRYFEELKELATTLKALNGVMISRFVTAPKD